MQIKNPQQVIRSLYTNHAEKLDNVIYADKIFIINSIVNHLFRDKHYTEIDKSRLLRYGEIISRFLEDELDVYWKDGKLMVKEMGNEFEGG